MLTRRLDGGQRHDGRHDGRIGPGRPTIFVEDRPGVSAAEFRIASSDAGDLAMFAPSQALDMNALVLCRKVLLHMKMTDMNVSGGLEVGQGLLQKMMDSQSDILIKTNRRSTVLSHYRLYIPNSMLSRCRTWWRKRHREKFWRSGLAETIWSTFFCTSRTRSGRFCKADPPKSPLVDRSGPPNLHMCTDQQRASLERV